MEEKKKESKEIVCTSETCKCRLCYEQEFCNRCEGCENESNKKESCNAFEGAYNY